MKKVLLFLVIVLILGLGVYGIMRKNSTSEHKNQNSNTTETTNKNKNSSNTTGSYKDIKSTTGSDIVLYVGDGRDQGENACPHCVKVEEFIKANKIDEKVILDIKEVWYHQENSSDLNETAKICNIPQNDIGVPLLLDKPNSKCYVGEDEITNFLNSKLK